MTDPGAAVRKRQPFFSVNECEIWKGDPVYKLIVSDIDATLINSKFLIPDYNLEMIRRVREAGIQFMLCTGRLFGSARPYAKFLDLDTPLITSNGAVTMEWRERRDLFGTPMDPDTCAEVFRILDEMEMYYHFYSKDTFYSRKPLQEITGFRIMNEKLPEDERFPMLQTDDPAADAVRDPVYKISVRFFDPKDGQRFLERFESRTDIAITSSFSDNYEISAPGVDKGVAVARYAMMRGIRPEEIISFGDNKNDIGMIRYAGVGVAVANAVEELKSAADYVTDTNENSGVGKALAKIGFGE